ncbi:MAG: ADP-ribosylglycohydrolase family protein [Spirulinaceae cyanobacterium]
MNHFSRSQYSQYSPIISGLIGLSVADALGVPVEFTSRSQRTRSPVTTMQGYGTYNQPPGTWSDDSSLTFCLAEALCQWQPNNTEWFNQLATKFCAWYQDGYWTPHGECFDIGRTTAIAIQRLQSGVEPTQAGETGERSNGNGSLMRILPLAYCWQKLSLEELLQLTHQVSCLTHAHPRSQLACGFYIILAVKLLQGVSLPDAYGQTCQFIDTFYSQPPYSLEKHYFQRILNNSLASLPPEQIQSSGYVIHTLEASLWCLLNTNTYSEAVLKAVNLGDDTDTTGAVTGGLAGIYYGLEAIPQTWLDTLPRRSDIIALAKRLDDHLITNILANPA